jgi:hypothetical protein
LPAKLPGPAASTVTGWSKEAWIRGARISNDPSPRAEDTTLATSNAVVACIQFNVMIMPLLKKRLER